MKRKVSVGVIASIVIAASISLSSALSAVTQDAPNLNPTADLSAVRYIYCDNPNGKDGWTGSGAMVGKDSILTALHVANGANCHDIGTGHPLRMYASDEKHDIAFMTGNLPEIPPFKMSCQPYVKGQTYIAFGVSDYYRKTPLFRLNVLVANGRRNVKLSDGLVDKDIQDMKGAIVPGMSGGPIIDAEGLIHGVVNIGEQDFMGLPTKSSGSYELALTPFCKKGK